MAKTLEQLYDEIRGSEKLSKELADILGSKDKEKLADWIKAQDCDASIEEARQFLQEKAEELKDSGELTPEQLEAAAGGIWEVTTVIIMTVMIYAGEKAADAIEDSCK